MSGSEAPAVAQAKESTAVVVKEHVGMVKNIAGGLLRRLPPTTKRGREIAEAADEISQQSGRAARDREIAENLGMPLEQYHDTIRDISEAKTQSLESLFEMAGDVCMPAEGDGVDEAIDQSRLQERIHGALASIPKRLRNVIVQYYQEGLTDRAIADQMGVTESRAHQIRTEAIEALKKGLARPSAEEGFKCVSCRLVSVAHERDVCSDCHGVALKSGRLTSSEKRRDRFDKRMREKYPESVAEREAIVAYVREHGPCDRMVVRVALGMDAMRFNNRMTTLLKRGEIVQTDNCFLRVPVEGEVAPAPYQHPRTQPRRPAPAKAPQAPLPQLPKEPAPSSPGSVAEALRISAQAAQYALDGYIMDVVDHEFAALLVAAGDMAIEKGLPTAATATQIAVDSYVESVADPVILALLKNAVAFTRRAHSAVVKQEALVNG